MRGNGGKEKERKKKEKRRRRKKRKGMHANIVVAESPFVVNGEPLTTPSVLHQSDSLCQQVLTRGSASKFHTLKPRGLYTQFYCTCNTCRVMIACFSRANASSVICSLFLTVVSAWL